MSVRVVIIDGPGIVLRGLRRLLERHPETVVVGEAHDRESAATMLALHTPDVAIVGLAIDGESPLLGALLRVSPATSIIVFTATADPALAESALAGGAAGLLLKSSSAEELLQAVRAGAAGHIYLQPELTRALISRLTGRVGDDGIVRVTAREMEVLQLIADGMNTTEAATVLDRSPATIKTHVRSVFKKLGANHRAHAVAMALRLRIIR